MAGRIEFPNRTVKHIPGFFYHSNFLFETCDSIVTNQWIKNKCRIHIRVIVGSPMSDIHVLLQELFESFVLLIVFSQWLFGFFHVISFRWIKNQRKLLLDNKKMHTLFLITENGTWQWSSSNNDVQSFKPTVKVFSKFLRPTQTWLWNHVHILRTIRAF